jgi:hypothetical protein
MQHSCRATLQSPSQSHTCNITDVRQYSSLLKLPPQTPPRPSPQLLHQLCRAWRIVFRTRRCRFRGRCRCRVKIQADQLAIKADNSATTRFQCHSNMYRATGYWIFNDEPPNLGSKAGSGPLYRNLQNRRAFSVPCLQSPHSRHGSDRMIRHTLPP